MPYVVNGTELDTDEQGYLVEPDFSDEIVHVIAAAEGLSLSDAHWTVVNYLRDEYREHGRHRQQGPVRPVPHRAGQAGLQGGGLAAAAGQRRLLMNTPRSACGASPQGGRLRRPGKAGSVASAGACGALR